MYSLDVPSYYHNIVKANVYRLSASGKRPAISKDRLDSARCDASDYESTYAPCMLILMEREITPIYVSGDVNFSCHRHCGSPALSLRCHQRQPSKPFAS